MAITTYLTKLKELFIQTETTFNQNIFDTNAPGSAYRLDAEGISFTPNREFIKRETQLGTLGGISGLVGGRGGTVKFKMGVRGSIVATPHVVDSVLASALLASGMKRYCGQHDSTVATTDATTTQIKLGTDAGYADYGVGNAGTSPNTIGAPFVAIETTNGASPVALEVRAILASASGGTQTVAPAFTRGTSQVTPDAVHGADVWAPIADATGIITGPSTCSIVAYENGLQYTFTGCFGGPPKISGQSGKRMTMEFSFEVTSWVIDSYTLSPPDQVSAVPGSVLGLGASAYWKAGVSTVLPINSFELDFGMKVKPIMSMTATDGKAGWVPDGLEPVAKFDPYFSTSWDSDFNAGTEDLALFQFGTLPGSTLAVLLPSAQISKYPNPEDIGGVAGHKIEMRGNVPFSSADNAALGMPPALLAFY